MRAKISIFIKFCNAVAAICFLLNFYHCRTGLVSTCNQHSTFTGVHRAGNGYHALLVTISPKGFSAERVYAVDGSAAATAAAASSKTTTN